MSNKSEKQRKLVSDFKFGIKLQPDHFPTGTVFRISNELANFSNGENSIRTFTTSGVAYNSPGHFVVRTTTRDEVCDVMRGFSHTHIVEIIKRGDGPVKYENKSIKDWVYNRQLQLQELIQLIGVTTLKMKNHTIAYSVIDMLIYHHSALKSCTGTDAGVYIDLDVAERALNSQSFVRHYRDAEGQSLLYTAPKKRLKRWFKQNYNRFLKPVKQAKKEYEDILRSEYERDNDY